MKIRHEVCIDNKGDTKAVLEDVLVALGHGPSFKYRADSPTDTVHGAVTIHNCDPRTIGESILWHDNVVRVLTVDNVAAYFTGQGHKLVKVIGGKAYGNTIIDIKITDTDEAPTPGHKTTYKRAAPILPTAKECCDKLDACFINTGRTV